MENITIVSFTDEVTGITTETVLIDRGNGEFISMLKSVYDAQQEVNNAN